MWKRSAIRSALDEGRVPLGFQCFSGSAPLLEIAGLAGFDFVMIDTEHACIDTSQVENLVRACETVDLMPLVRVSSNEPTAIRKALEAGARGVIIPQVKTADDVRAALDAARYPMSGSRGMCPLTRASRYSVESWSEYQAWVNEEVHVIPILENPDAIANVEEICAIDGIDIVNFGPGDLGMAMGFGAAGMSRPEVEEAFEHVVAVANRTGRLVMGVPFPDTSAEACKSLIDRGVRILLHSIDELLFYRACQTIVADLKPVLGTPAR